MGAAQAEIDQQLALGGEHHARRLGGNERLEVEEVHDPRFDELGCGNGAVMRTIGSLAKNSVPSGMAWTSPVKRSAAR